MAATQKGYGGNVRPLIILSDDQLKASYRDNIKAARLAQEHGEDVHPYAVAVGECRMEMITRGIEIDKEAKQ
jgi:hypothetical protein